MVAQALARFRLTLLSSPEKYIEIKKKKKKRLFKYARKVLQIHQMYLYPYTTRVSVWKASTAGVNN